MENYSQKIIFDFFNNFADIKYWVTASESYTKKTNLLEDNSQWEGWVVRLELESEQPIEVDKIVKKLFFLNQSDLEMQSNRHRKKYLDDYNFETMSVNTSMM